MPTEPFLNPLQEIRRLAEVKRREREERKRLEEVGQAIARVQPSTVPTPKLRSDVDIPPEMLEGMRDQVVRLMPDRQLKNALGIALEDDVSGLRADPRNYLQHSPEHVRQRYVQLVREAQQFGGAMPTVVTPELEKVLQQIYAAWDGAEAEKKDDWTQPFAGFRMTWKGLFGDTSVRNPLAESNIKPTWGELTVKEPGKALQYIQHRGIVGALEDISHAIGVVAAGSVLSSVDLLLTPLFALTGTKLGLREKINEHVQEGIPTLDAINMGYEEVDMPFHIKGLTETLTNPVSWGLKIPQTIGQVGVGVGREAVRLGRAVAEKKLVRKVVGKEALKFEETVIGKEGGKIIDDVMEGKFGIAQAAPLAEVPSQAPTVAHEILAGVQGRIGQGEQVVVKQTTKSVFGEPGKERAGEVQRLFQEELPLGKAVQRLETYEGGVIGRGAQQIVEGGRKVTTRLLPEELPTPDQFLSQMNKPNFFRPEIREGVVPDAMAWGNELWGWTKDVVRGTLRPIATLADPLKTVVEPLSKFFMDRQMTLAWGDQAKQLGLHAMKYLSNFLEYKGGTLGSVLYKTGSQAGERVPMKVFMDTAPDKLDEVFEIRHRGAKAFHKLGRQLIDEVEQYRLKYGVIKKEDLLDNYWPRFFENKSAFDQLRREMKFTKEGISPVGAKTTSQQVRGWEFIDDGVRNGVNYLDDAVAVFSNHMSDTFRAIADIRLKRNFINSGLGVEKEVVQEARRHNKLLRGHMTRVIHGTGAKFNNSLQWLDEMGDEAVRAAIMLPPEQRVERLLVLREKASAALGEIKEKLLLAKTGFELGAGGPFLEGTVAEEKTAKMILDALNRDPVMRIFGHNVLEGDLGKLTGAALRLIEGWTNLSRLALATYDLSAMMLQGLPTLFLRPDVWGKATKQSLEALVTGAARHKYMLNNITAIKEFQAANGLLGSSEFMVAAEGGFLQGRGFFGKIGGSLGKSVEPFNRSFDTLGDVIRVELWQALRSGLKVGEPQIVAGFINKLTGLFSTQAMGVAPKQRMLESILLFSPRYNRAGLALLADTFQGGLRGELARNALAHFTVAGLASYLAIAQTLGQEPKLNPLPVSKGGDGAAFMTWEIGGHRWGYGSWWMTYYRLLGAIYGDTAANPEGFLSWDSLTGVSEDLGRFVRGKLGPGVSRGLDVLTGRTYLGERIDVDGFTDFLTTSAKFMSEGFVSINLQNLLEGNPEKAWWDRVRENVKILPVSTVGSRVFPSPLQERLEELEEGLVDKKLEEFDIEGSKEELLAGKLNVPVEWQGLLGLKRITEQDKQWIMLDEERKGDKGRRGRDVDLLFLDIEDEWDKVREEYRERTKMAEEVFWGKVKSAPEDVLNGKAFRDSVTRAGIQMGEAFDRLEKDKEFSEVFELLDKKLEKKIGGKIFAGDAAYLDYIRQVVKKDDVPVRDGGFMLEDGTPDFKRRQEKVEEIIRSWATPRFSVSYLTEYVKQRQEYRGGEVGVLAKDLKRAREEVLAGYWEIEEKLFGKREDYDEIRKWLHGGSAQEQYLAKLRVKDAERVTKKLAAERRTWLLLHPEGDMFRALFYGAQPITLEAKQRLSDYVRRHIDRQ